MGALANSKTTLASAVANGGTVTLNYPTGSTQASLQNQGPGVVVVDGNTWPEGTGTGTVAIAYGASNITVTNNSGVTWPAFAELISSFGRVDIAGSYNLTFPRKVQVAVG